MPIPSHVAPRLKVNRISAKTNIIMDSQFSDVTDTEIDDALTTIDQDAIYDKRRTELVAEVWDRVSPINDVPASHFLNRGDVPPIGDVYLIRDTVTGNIVTFQPHEPDAVGIIPVPVGQGLARGKLHADNLAASHAADEVLTKVREKIVSSRAQATGAVE